MGRISPQARFRIQEEIPDNIPPGYTIRIETEEIETVKQFLDGSAPQHSRGQTRRQLRPSPIKFVRPPRGGWLHHTPAPAFPPTTTSGDKIKVFVKQEVWDFDTLDRWMDASARITNKLGMPPWALFKLKPMDGDFDV
jgi:hypothetical protein